MPKTFLTANWNYLAMANYAIDPEILKPYVPYKTELDFFEGNCYVSLVGFRFYDTKVLGIRVPFHSDFTEVNLRFYVRYKEDNVWKRGTVFISEIVPKPAITFVANTFYGEHYETMPVRNNIQHTPEKLTVEYTWKKSDWNRFSVECDSQSGQIVENSIEEFITEHYWGYTKLTDAKTSEYGVEHPRWNAFPVTGYSLDVDFKDLYGANFSFLADANPNSVLVADGSDILVRMGKKI